MRAPVSTFVRTALVLEAGCITTEAFLQPPAVGSSQPPRVSIIASSSSSSLPPSSPLAGPATHIESCFALLRPHAAPAGCSRARSSGLRPSARGRRSARGDEVGRKGLEAGNTQQQQASGSGRSCSAIGKWLARRLTPSAASAAATAHLRQAAATTLAAVLLVASTSTEQDIMTAMMGLDPSLATAGTSSNSGAQKSAMTLPKDEQVGGKSSSGSRPSSTLGSIDLTGQSTGAGEIPGSAGGGFKDGRLMVDLDSDLATMLGKKMKTPDAEPLTH